MTDDLAKSLLRNPSDPLHDAEPEANKVLLEKFGQVANGFPMEAVIHAAADVILNAIRQTHAKRSKAEATFNEIMSRTREVLLSQHYDALGNRRNIFPYDQKLELPLVVNQQKFNT